MRAVESRPDTPSPGPAPRDPRRVAGVGLVAAAVAVAGPLAIPLPGVPLTLQSLAVSLAGLLLGPRDGAAAVAVYLAAGAIGLPVFAGGKAGAGVLVGPTGGFLFGFLAQAALTGWWAERGPGRGLPRLVVACLAGYVPLFAAGAVGLVVFAGLPAREAAATTLAFTPGALIKSALAAALAARLGPRLPPPWRRPLDPDAADPQPDLGAQPDPRPGPQPDPRPDPQPDPPPEEHP